MGDRKLAASRYAARFLEHSEHQPFARALLAAFDNPEAAIGVLRSAFEDPDLDDPIRVDAIAFWAIFFGDDDFEVIA